MRIELSKKRKAAGLTQKQMAEKMAITERYYRMIEAGEVNGSIWIWDFLEDFFGVDQRTLRRDAPDKLI